MVLIWLLASPESSRRSDANVFGKRGRKLSNREKYDQAFIKTLLVAKEDLEDLKYQEVSGWDSVGHMALMGALEEAFQIELDIDDIIDFSSYKFGQEILAKYDVEID